MIGTIVNIVAIAIGSTIGLLIRSKLPPRLFEIVFQVLGLFTLFLGFKMALETQRIIYVVFSLLIGGLLGELLQIEKRIDYLADILKKIIPGDNSRFQEGLITSFLLFCIGSMTIMGAIEEGLNNNPELLFTKSLMDGFSSIALSSAMGIGVLFSVVPVLIFQGGLTLLASSAQDFLSPIMISELSAVGGLLLIGLGINILEIKKIRVTNMLPALLVVVFMVLIFG